LQKQAQLSHTQQALGDVVKQFQAGDINDQKNQARTVAAMSAIDPDAGRSFAESLRALGGRYTFYTDVLGQHWIGDTQRGTEHKGELGAPRSGAGRGGANVPITTEEARTTAQIGAQALANILHIVQTDPDALHVPAIYAGISNAKTAGGIAGALAGMVEPLAQTQLSPHQQMIMRFRDQFLESYMALITGKRGAGSPALLSLARNSFFPMANQDDPQVHASAVKSMRFALSKLQALGGGQAVTLDGLPGYTQAIREGLGLEGATAPEATPNMPGAAGQAPLGFGDLLKGVPGAPPVVDRKP